MLFSSIAAIASLLAVGTEARHFKRDDGVTISSYRPLSKRAPSEISLATAVLPLKKIPAKGAAAAYRKNRLGKFSSLVTIPDGNTTGIIALDLGEEIAAEVTIGDQTFDLIIDTGSSDTWVAEAGFSCTDFETGEPAAESACGFGTLYNVTSTFKPISGEEFDIEYGDLETLTGTFGTEEVTIANITVDQQIAVVTDAYWDGDGTSSGLMGLAYPPL